MLLNRQVLQLHKLLLKVRAVSDGLALRKAQGEEVDQFHSLFSLRAILNTQILQSEIETLRPMMLAIEDEMLPLQALYIKERDELAREHAGLAPDTPLEPGVSYKVINGEAWTQAQSDLNERHAHLFELDADHKALLDLPSKVQPRKVDEAHLPVFLGLDLAEAETLWLMANPAPTEERTAV